jgi:hypothetical protein
LTPARAAAVIPAAPASTAANTDALRAMIALHRVSQR